MSRIIPEQMKMDTKVQVVLPPEVTTLLQDLHRDREGIAIGGLVLLVCAVALTFKKLSSSKP